MKHIETKLFKATLLLYIFFLLFSCGRQADSVTKQENKNSLMIPDTIISKYYGNDTGETELFNDDLIKCTMSQVIDGSSCASNIFLYFSSKTKKEIKIETITGQMSWKQKEKVIESPFTLESINAIIFNNDKLIDQSSFLSSKLITNKFKSISGIEDQLTYDITFADPTYKNIPSSIQEVIIDLQFEISINGKLKQYKRQLALKKIFVK
ncbi:MAG: hypothetical protein IPH32_18280 [Bacteroidetes bacterium]|nr:hypothetical protein [Bacteroidota bacterium]